MAPGRLFRVAAIFGWCALTACAGAGGGAPASGATRSPSVTAREREPRSPGVTGGEPERAPARSPLPAPSGAPEHALGFDHAVRGCVPGYVYEVGADYEQLGVEYARSGPRATYWACEWTGAPGERGVPGVPIGARYVVRYQGLFAIPAGGRYDFELRAYGPSRLSVDGQVLVETRGELSLQKPLNLLAGPHTLLLECLQRPTDLRGPRLGVRESGAADDAFSLRPGSSYASEQGIYFPGALQVGERWRARVRLARDQIAVSEPIEFEPGGSSLSAAAEPLLYGVARLLDEHPELAQIEVQGAAEDLGAPDVELRLAQQRAASVRRWLIVAGVAPHRVSAAKAGYRRLAFVVLPGAN